jgi:hypothetical protein
MSALNPSKKYPRRYERGHFLKLCDNPTPRYTLAYIVFSILFANGKLREAFKYVSRYWLASIFIGIAVTVTGHSYMLVRSIALLACAVWLSIDAGIFLSEGNLCLLVKPIIFSAATTVSFAAAMGIMYWFLSSTLEDQRTDIWNHLTARAYANQSEIGKTVFSVTNGGSQLIGHHSLSCGIEEIAFIGGHGGISSYTTRLRESESRMQPGDSQSDPCLSGFDIEVPVQCADIFVNFSYQLANQCIAPR